MQHAAITMNYLYRLKKKRVAGMEAVFVGLEHEYLRRVDKWTSINKWFRVVDDCARYSTFSLRFRFPLLDLLCSSN